MNVLLLRTWLTNVGNGFIDKGARTIIRDAFHDAAIIEVSGYPNLLANRRNDRPVPGGPGRLVSDGLQKTVSGAGTVQESPTNVGELVEADVAVLPGCTLYDHVLEPYFPLLEHLRRNEVPLVLLGAGGGDYEPETQSSVREVLDVMDSLHLITRDSTAYDNYTSLAETAHDGIDCAFFIDDWYVPPDSSEPLTALTFDKRPEPDIDPKNTIMRPCHTPFGTTLAFDRPIRQLNMARNTRKPFRGQDRFVSDILTDYLFIYANAETTHSDRIHACVPALTFGNEARFYFETPRANLFEKVLDEYIGDGLVSLDRSRLDELKEEQVTAFRTAVRTSVPDAPSQ
jgi:hypothetical protein